ncbi:AAA family ATPase [Sedimentisphaera salicampi]|uniref:Regulatory ATPase RavA n=1 Tax=Sedimentisphaera salicampi TaxID=1941349 RepID=A0A1W6LLN3_9BACT|nr:AAA family ATPase [Sedimentisphaera salicampi]ARN56675.1 regulatory ATPase RavA [Sedimentisphaera salicampi]OXU15113.1 regulatory ATPase RavA [Sedimentisphaera salicampi]
MPVDIDKINAQIEEKSSIIEPLLSEASKAVIGQRYMLERMLIAILCDGHILLEGVPGLAKTTAVTALSQAIKADFRRIQFTPDLLPADLTGTQIYRQSDGQFYTRKGPVFANIILADEINRAPAKVQSALLEAMQEKQVTIGDETYQLPQPFLVLATQNPIEQEGTYPLPEAQLDRFMLKISVGYPTKEQERQILDLKTNPKAAEAINSVISPDSIFQLREVISQIYIDQKVKDYIVEVVHTTRHPSVINADLASLINFGSSPRATIALALAARAQAFLKGRGYVTPQDVKTIGMDVLRHRIIVSYEAEAQEITSEDVVKMIFDNVEVP